MKIVIENFVNDMPSTELDPHSRIVFGAGHDRIAVSVRDGIVEISGEQRLSIQPRAANVIWLSPIDKRNPG